MVNPAMSRLKLGFLYTIKKKFQQFEKVHTIFKNLMSIIEKSSSDEKSYYAKKPFTTPMILLHNDTLLSLQHKDSVNGML
jgi:hypothetical protein